MTSVTTVPATGTGRRHVEFKAPAEHGTADRPGSAHGGLAISHVRRPDARPHRRTKPAFDLVASKLHRPSLRPGTVRRSSLIEQLARRGSAPIVSVTAPAGYGKTTLLSQWAERHGRAFAWVSVDEGDNDPKVLLTYVAEALDAIEPIDPRIFDALAASASSLSDPVIPQLSAAFCSMTAPVVLVIDDVHSLHTRQCRAALGALAGHVPSGSRLVLAGRTRPPLPTARLRAEGKIVEIGPADLSLTLGEARSLLGNVDLALGEDDVAELHRRTEGWPAGLYLAALHLREADPLPEAVACFGGADRFINDYVESEFLARISRRQREFLTRTAVLERMCGPLCEAVLRTDGSRATLANLAQSNLLLVSLDRRGEWCRYHHLFRDMLLAELHRHEPGLMPVLRRRAASWCLDNGLPEEALEYSMAAGDVESAVRLVERLGVQAHRQARFATLRRWFGWLEDQRGIEGHPMAAVLASLLSAVTARPDVAERWADAVDRWQYRDASRPDDPAAEAWAAVLRAMLCRHGVSQMLADAEEALNRCAAVGIVAPAPVLYYGLAQVLCGDLDGGDESLRVAASFAEKADVSEALAVALGERSLVAMARGEWDQVETLSRQARAVLQRAGIQESFVTPLVCAVRARAAWHRGDIPAAREELVSAQRLRHLLTYALPTLAVQARIELARVYLALADLTGARTLLREIDELLRRRPGLGALVGEAQALRVQVAEERGSPSCGASSLTAAELRVLPLLATHLSFPEIGGELFVSRHTVKSQANSIYRKLGASTRSQAVAQARTLGLLEG
jgi:LuxR family transcriptional regulator, maltose regulon positive regulatory protein